jgi:twitching motility protein PilU
MNSEHINALLEEMQKLKASDLYLTYACPPTLRISDRLAQLTSESLTDADLSRYLGQMLTPEQIEEFQVTLEFNTALNFNEVARFRVNVFRQQGHDGLVVRRIQMDIPTLESLNLPTTYADMALMKRGLILVAGPTGSGKSTSLAAMIGHRNRMGSGHIVTVEDPIEFIHRHDQCIITQRDVGLDTYSYSIALKNTLRQQPDMVVIGEVRDREVMEQAIYFAETSHLCIATIHANNSSQVIERVLNFFPEERHPQILMNLSLNLRAVLSQRLVPNIQGAKSLALEVMLNQGLIRQLIEEGKVRQVREMIEKGASDGMQTFDQSLFELYRSKTITEEVAIAESDSPANLRLQISNNKREGGMNTRVASNMIVNVDSIKNETSF